MVKTMTRQHRDIGATRRDVLKMAGAIATVHGPNGFSLPKGYEYNFAIIALCVALILIGPGTLAVDRFFHIRRKK